MQVQESDLLFDFDNTHWQVKKYDQHRYYKTLSGVGLKGVDFIGIFQKQQVVFIEVKNFRAKHPSRKEPFSVLTDTKKFIDKIADKLEDTFRATSAILAYLNKKWWYRLFLKWEMHLPMGLFLQRDWFFWHTVGQLSTKKADTIFILWLEIEERISDKGKIDLDGYIQQQLNKELAEFADTILVASMDKPLDKMRLKVRELIQNN